MEVCGAGSRYGRSATVPAKFLGHAHFLISHAHFCARPHPPLRKRPHPFFLRATLTPRAMQSIFGSQALHGTTNACLHARAWVPDDMHVGGAYKCGCGQPLAPRSLRCAAVNAAAATFRRTLQRTLGGYATGLGRSKCNLGRPQAKPRGTTPTDQGRAGDAKNTLAGVWCCELQSLHAATRRSR